MKTFDELLYEKIRSLYADMERIRREILAARGKLIKAGEIWMDFCKHAADYNDGR